MEQSQGAVPLTPDSPRRAKPRGERWEGERKGGSPSAASLGNRLNKGKISIRFFEVRLKMA